MSNKTTPMGRIAVILSNIEGLIDKQYERVLLNRKKGGKIYRKEDGAIGETKGVNFDTIFVYKPKQELRDDIKSGKAETFSIAFNYQGLSEPEIFFGVKNEEGITYSKRYTLDEVKKSLKEFKNILYTNDLSNLKTAQKQILKLFKNHFMSDVNPEDALISAVDLLERVREGQKITSGFTHERDSIDSAASAVVKNSPKGKLRSELSEERKALVEKLRELDQELMHVEDVLRKDMIEYKTTHNNANVKEKLIDSVNKLTTLDKNLNSLVRGILRHY